MAYYSSHLFSKCCRKRKPGKGTARQRTGDGDGESCEGAKAKECAVLQFVLFALFDSGFGTGLKELIGSGQSESMPHLRPTRAETSRRITRTRTRLSPAVCDIYYCRSVGKTLPAEGISQTG